MDHSCEHHFHHEQNKALTFAIWVAFIFMIAEVIGGWIANSLALISDALHLFTDVGALLLSLIVLKIARRPSTPSMTYGYHRAEILGALASALSLWALSGVLIYESIMRLLHPVPVEGPIVFVIATIGLFANLLMFKALHPTRNHSLNVKSAYLHVIGDLLGSAGVILSGAILWTTHWYPIDPLITIAFTLGILYSSGKVIKDSCAILMEATPSGIDPIALQGDLTMISGVKEVHDLHIWSVTPKRIALSVHLVSEHTQRTLSDAHHLIEKKYNIHHMTIQVEDPAHFQSKYCYDCAKTSNSSES